MIYNARERLLAEFGYVSLNQEPGLWIMFLIRNSLPHTHKVFPADSLELIPFLYLYFFLKKKNCPSLPDIVLLIPLGNHGLPLVPNAAVNVENPK